MDRKVFKEVEKFAPDKHVHVSLMATERVKVILLCLSRGLAVPPHSHPGFDVTLQPLKGKALLPTEGREDVPLVPGEIVFADGASSFGPKNPFDEDFEMLIHLIKR